MRRLIAALAGLLVALGLVVVPGAAPAAAKSFRLTLLTTEATVAPDGTMAVREQITYDFDGSFTVGIRSFEPASRGQITAFTASEDGVPLDVISPENSISGEWEWEFPTAVDEQRTFLLTYTVINAVPVGADVGELYWKFVGNDHPGIDHVSITIDVPSGEGDLRAWGHGPRSGRVTVDPARVVLAVDDVPAAEFVEARLAIPSSRFTVAPSGEPRLDRIIGQEDEFASDRDREATLREAGRIAGPVLGGLGLVAFGLIWRVWGKEPRPPDTIGEYWQEPLEDPPAVVSSTLEFGRVDGSAFSSTVVDLAQRGFLTIDETTEERIGPDKTAYHFRWTGNSREPLQPYEQLALDHIFRGRAEASSDEFAKWARSHPGTAQEFWSKWKRLVRTDVTTRGYLETGRPGPWIALVFLLLVLGVGGLACIGLAEGHWLSFAPWAAGIVCLLLASTLRRRTPRGAEQAAEANALKRFLKDFSSLDEAPVGHLKLWERYLVYAVALGVSADLVRGLEAKVPEVAQSGSFAPWYTTGGVHSPGSLVGLGLFRASFGASVLSSVSPSRSGSSGFGGGFSGGGGGGGGGGGFGAR